MNSDIDLAMENDIVEARASLLALVDLVGNEGEVGMQLMRADRYLSYIASAIEKRIQQYNDERIKVLLP